MSAALTTFLLGAPPIAGEPSLVAAPEDPYVLSGYVPAGFAAFGTWTAVRRTELYRSPGSRKVVATIDRCAEVTAEDGELRGHPREIRVMKPHPPFRQGERMWILARNLEEGYFQLWYRGAVRDELAVTLEADLSFAEERCRTPSPKCWLWIDKDSAQEHWVRIHGKDGTFGWTSHLEAFVEGTVDRGKCE